jgi:hypothetical protein
MVGIMIVITDYTNDQPWPQWSRTMKCQKKMREGIIRSDRSMQPALPYKNHHIERRRRVGNLAIDAESVL